MDHDPDLLPDDNEEFDEFDEMGQLGLFNKLAQQKIGSVNITLVTKGGIISGTLCSPEEYIAFIREDTYGGLVRLAESKGEQPDPYDVMFPDPPRNLPSPKNIFLKDVIVFLGGDGRYIAKWMTVYTDSVVGWTLGSPDPQG